MKRDGGNLEEQTRAQRDEGNHRNGIIRGTLFERIGDFRKSSRSSDAIEQRHAVEQHAGRKRTQQEVLQRRFIGSLISAQKTDENIGRNRHRSG